MSSIGIADNEGTRKRGGLLSLARIAYRNIYRNKRRSVFCIIAISVIVFFIIAMAAMMDGMIDNFRKQIRTYETGDVLITSGDFEKKSLFLPLQYPLSLGDKNLEESIAEIESIPGVESASPRIKTRVSLMNSTIKSAIMWGIDMEDELSHAIFNYKTKNANDCLLSGRYPNASANECAIGFLLARKMGAGIGDKVQLKIISSEFSTRFFFPVIVGITDFNNLDMDRNAIIVPFARAQKLAQVQGQTQMLLVFAKQGYDTKRITAKIVSRYGELQNVSIKPYDLHPYIVLLDVSNIMMAIIYIVFMVVASFSIINTIIMVIHERIKEIGMMGALGMTRGEIVTVFFLESLVLSSIGSLIGCSAGGIVTGLLSLYPFDLSALYGDMIAMNNTIFVTFSPSIIAQGFFYGLIVSGACTIFPSLKSAFVKPVEAIRR